MIRILHVVTHMNRGGLETILMNYYRNIDREKVQFDFLVHRQERAAYDDEIETLGGIIHRLPRLVPWSASYHRALNHFFAVHPEYRIVHVHQDCLSSVILKAAKKHGVPVRIAHSHNSNQDRNLKYLVKLICKRSITTYATELFACSKQAGDWMFDGAPFLVLNNAIDAKLYQCDAERARMARARLSIPENALILGHVGRFCPQKNHSFLIDVFSQVLKRKPDAYLLLVGDGELKTDIEMMIQAQGMTERVVLTGVRGDIPDLLQAMDVFVFPSLYEGLGVCIIEAQAAGLPCLISDKVPIECKKTDLVRQIPLNDGTNAWADAALDAAKMPRRNTLEEIRAASYDIRENALWLQNFYLSKEKQEI